MANLQLPHIFLGGTTLEAQEVNANFAALAAKFGALTTQDLSSSAGILNSQLANDDYEIVLSAQITGVQWAAVAATGDPVTFVGLPYDVADGAETYNILSVDYCWFDKSSTVSVAPEFFIDWGYFSSGTWTQTTAVLASGSAQALSATASTTDTLTLSNSEITTSASNKNFFAIMQQTAGTGWDTADQVLVVTIKLKRANGLRS